MCSKFSWKDKESRKEFREWAQLVISLITILLLIAGLIVANKIYVNLREVRTEKLVLVDPEGNVGDCLWNNGSVSIWGPCPEGT